VSADATARLDIWSHGIGTRRGVEVRTGEEALEVGDLRIPYGNIFWTSRRAGLFMVFSNTRTVALQGAGRELDVLARAVEKSVGRADQRRRLPPELTGEGVVCTAGTAAVGRAGGARIRGLWLAVVTRRGLHLLSAGEHHGIPWPADEARELDEATTGGRGPAVEVARGEDRVRLLYLFAEEARVIVRTAQGVPESEGPEIEMFARRDVAPPVAAEMPVLRLTVDSLQALAEETAGELPVRTAERAGLGKSFFETHYLELGEIALGPLLLRKSAASGARTLARAVDAMDADELQEDTRAAVTNATRRLVEAYDRELASLLESKRIPSRMRARYRISDASREEVRLRLLGPFERLVPLLRQLEERQRDLSENLETLEAGPPEGGEAGLDGAIGDWKRMLRRVDAAYEEAWREALGEISDVWGKRLLPQLAEVGAMPRRRIPEWAQLVLIAALALIVAAVIMILVVW
jgi:hypothetical protein